MDTVFIRGLSLDAVIGCYDWEKTKTQTITLDIDMAWDIKRAADSDLLEYTLDYAAVSQRIEQYVTDTQFELVESLAERIAELVMNEFKVLGIRIRLAKPQAIENTIDVGVSIARGVVF